MEEKNEFIVTQRRLIRDLRDLYNRQHRSWYWAVYFPTMPETKIFKFLKQFPWVLKFVRESEVAQVYVSGWDPRTAEAVLGHEHGGFEGLYERALLLDQNGEIVSRTYEISWTGKKYAFFGREVTKKVTLVAVGNLGNGDTIAKTVKDLAEVAERIAFIVSYDTWTRTLIVYKRPAGLTFDQWFKGEVPEAVETAEPVAV